MGVSVVFRTLDTKSAADDETLVLVPVTPIRLAAYTKPPHLLVTTGSLESEVLGATT